MRFFVFCAGFFRTKAPESSSRLVGIIAYSIGVAMGPYMVMTNNTSLNDIVILIIVLTYGAIALGLRNGVPTEFLSMVTGRMMQQPPPLPRDTPAGTAT